MQTCKTCRWWSRHGEGDCDVLGTRQAEEPDTLVVIDVVVADDTGLDVRLRTGPEFGCIHHEPRKEA